MIWALLYILIIGTSHTTFFLTPDLKKNVKSYVSEKNRQLEIFALMKIAKDRQKSFAKTRSDYMKHLLELSSNPEVTREELDALRDEFLAKQRIIQEEGIMSEMAMKQFTTIEEWNFILASFEHEKPKKNVSEHLERETGKIFEKIKKSCRKNIADDHSRKQALEAVNSFYDEIKLAIPAAVNINYSNTETIQNYEASLEDYEIVADRINNIRTQIWELALDTRFQLKELCTESEWKKVLKDYNIIFRKNIYAR